VAASLGNKTLFLHKKQLEGSVCLSALMVLQHQYQPEPSASGELSPNTLWLARLANFYQMILPRDRMGAASQKKYPQVE